MTHLDFAQARTGDPAAIRLVTEALRPRLVRMAGYYARRAGEDPDDLLQEAWLGALDALPGLDIAIGRPEQYLLQCARWRLLDALKRSRVRRCVALDLAGDIGDDALEQDLAAVALRDFTSRLKATQRTVLGCLLDGLTWRETGTVLGCTSANVAYHVRLIRAEYAAWMADGV